MAKAKKMKEIPLKNYLIAGIILVLLVLITNYFFNWYKLSQEERVANSYLITEKVLTYELNDIEELTTTLNAAELPNEYFVLISYTKTEETYELEKDLAPVIEDYNLNDKMYYVNVTDYKNEPNFLSDLNQAFGFTESIIKTIPTILFFEEGELAIDGMVIREDEHMINSGDFVKILDIHGYYSNQKFQEIQEI